MSPTPAAPRPAAQRRADTIARLRATEADVWVASAGADGSVHLVPLSYAWTGEHVVIAVTAESPTARNIEATGRARLGFGPTRDVVLVEAELAQVVPVAAPSGASIGEAYAAQADWDPREDPGSYRFLSLRPLRIQAWRESNELPGRLLMRDGAWLV